MTIVDGVEVTHEQFETLKNSIHLISSKTSKINLELTGIGSLDNWKGGAGETPYVIYLDILLHPNLLSVVDQISTATKGYDTWYEMPKPYLPHCTLAFRDLSQEGYIKGLAYLEGINPSITATIDHIALVEKLPDVDRELVRYNFTIAS